VEKCTQKCNYGNNGKCGLIGEAHGQAETGGDSSAVGRTAIGPYWPEKKWSSYVKQIERTAKSVQCKLLNVIRNELNALTRSKQQNRTLIKK